MRKGYDREGKVAALIRFSIGIVVIAVVLVGLYYLFVSRTYSVDGLAPRRRRARMCSPRRCWPRPTWSRK